jgi:hypothetical protein
MTVTTTGSDTFALHPHARGRWQVTGSLSLERTIAEST